MVLLFFAFGSRMAHSCTCAVCAVVAAGGFARPLILNDRPDCKSYDSCKYKQNYYCCHIEHSFKSRGRKLRPRLQLLPGFN